MGKTLTVFGYAVMGQLFLYAILIAAMGILWVITALIIGIINVFS